MTTKQNPTVKVGDKLIIRTTGMGQRDSIETVTKVTPSGLIKTATRTLGPDLRIRGLPRWSGTLCQAELATPEQVKEVQKAWAAGNSKARLSGRNWFKVSDDVALRIDKILQEEDRKAKDAQEKSE